MMRVTGGWATLAMLAIAVGLVACPTLPPSTTVGPDASFDAKPSAGTPPLVVRFTDTSKSGTSPIESWVWQFGDGTTSVERNPVHTYSLSRAYTVSLTVTTAIGRSTHVASGFVAVKEATTVVAVGPDGAVIDAEGARLAIPPQAFNRQVIVGVAANDGVVPINDTENDRLVSDVFSIAHDQGDLFVDIATPLLLEIPFISRMVPAQDRNGSKVQILARLESGVTVPIPGEVVNDQLVASLAGLPQRASYAVVYRPGLQVQSVDVDDFLAKAATGYNWRTNTWRIFYSEPQLQALTALRIGALTNLGPYERRDYSQEQLDITLSDLRTILRELHSTSRLAGFISPALIPSLANEFTLLLYNINDPVLTNYLGVAQVAFATSAFGAIVIDPAQLIAISQRNANPLEDPMQPPSFDRAQELDAANAFGQEFFRAMFRGYGFPDFARESQMDLDVNENPRMIPFFQGFADGLATMVGQVASALHVSQATGNDPLLAARSMGLNEYSNFWEPLFAAASQSMPAYSYSTQDFFFYVGRTFPDNDPATGLPKVFTFIADSYEGALELMRVRTNSPAVTGYAQAVFAANTACDLALQKTFDTTLANVYWSFVKGRAYENDDNSVLRPTDFVRKPFMFDADRFNTASMIQFTFGQMNEIVQISYDTNDILRDVPPLATRAILLSPGAMSGDLTITVNAWEWLPDANGNSMKVKVYRDGFDGVELDAINAQALLPGFGTAEGFGRAIVLLSNVTNDQHYPVSVTANLRSAGGSEVTGILGGQVTESGTGTPLAGVLVVVNKMDDTTVGDQLGSTTTDSRGLFLFTSLPPGNVQLTFSKTGYETQTLVRKVISGQQPTIVMLALRKLTP